MKSLPEKEGHGVLTEEEEELIRYLGGPRETGRGVIEDHHGTGAELAIDVRKWALERAREKLKAARLTRRDS